MSRHHHFRERRRAGVAPGVSAVSLGLLLLAGCKPVGPDYQRPGFTPPPIYKETGASNVVVPPPPAPNGGGWQPASPSDGMLKGKWWEVFNDPQLNTLEERIAAVNQGLHEAYENYLAAREQVKIARSAFYPTLSAGPGFSHDKISAHRPLVTPGDKGLITQYNDMTLEGQASWEPDFWGQIRRTVEGAKAAAQASHAWQPWRSYAVLRAWHTPPAAVPAPDPSIAPAVEGAVTS